MANTVNIRKLVDGRKYAYFHVYFQGDGSGEITNQVVIDPNVDLSPSLGVGQRFSLVKIWYGISGPALMFSFDAITDLPVWVVPATTLSGHVNFSEFGGILDKSGVDATGKLLFSTTGLAATGKGSFIVKVSKHIDPFVVS